MPTLIEMRLKATWTVRPDTRSLHGLACALFEGKAEPGTPVHTAPDKPWTVAPLAPGGTGSQWLWRAAWLPDAAVPTSVLTADVIRVGHVSCVVLESTQRRVSRAALAAGQPMTKVTVEFGSPTFFSRGGADLLLPDPRLMADSWQRKWNASLPAGDDLLIDDDAWGRPGDCCRWPASTCGRQDATQATGAPARPASPARRRCGLTGARRPLPGGCWEPCPASPSTAARAPRRHTASA